MRLENKVARRLMAYGCLKWKDAYTLAHILIRLIKKELAASRPEDKTQRGNLPEANR